MFEVISDKKLKKILKPIYLDQEEYDEKVKEYTKQVKKIIPMFGKEGKEEYNRAFMGDHGHQVKQIRDLTFSICCDHLIDIYVNYDMGQYDFEDMVSNAYLFANEYAESHTSYPEKLTSHKFFVEKSMEKRMANFIEKNSQIEIISTCEIDKYSQYGYSEN